MTKDEIVTAIQRLRFDVEHAPGASHLYDPFDAILNAITIYHDRGNLLDDRLAQEILAAVELLVRECSQGRRPWSYAWEDYFEKCLDDAERLLTKFSQFGNYRSFVPPGFCNILDDNLSLDRLSDGLPDAWQNRFLAMTLKASEMFKLIADEKTQFHEWWLENPDDRFFTNILSGYAQTGQARVLLLRYTLDDEPWVRSLAGQLLKKYY